MRLECDVRGTGEPLVLLHGLSHSRRAWDPVLDRLTPHRTVITLDLPGHGGCPFFEAGAGDPNELILDSLQEAFAELGVERPHVAGNSLGGLLALMLALRGAASSVTALSPAGFFAGRLDWAYTRSVFRTSRWFAQHQRGQAAKAVRSPIARTLMYGVYFGKPWRLDPDQCLADLDSLLGCTAIDPVFDLDPTTMRDGGPYWPDLPVTIAWGRRDLLLPRYQARYAARAFPQARMLTLPGCGHVPMPDDPDLVARTLLAGSATTAGRRAA